jgi:beta-galactosidase
MWLWHAFAGGLSFACNYRYRQPLYGSELYHYGIVRTDGVTPSPGGLQYSQVAREMRELRAKYDPNAKPPAAYDARRTAILWNHDNLWNIDYQKQTALWDVWGHMFRYVEIAKSFGAPLDIISEGEDFTKYPVLIAPAYQLIDEELVRKWTRYAEAGGNLILTARTGQKKRNGQLWEARWAEPIYPLIGAEVSFFDLLLEDGKGEVRMNDKAHAWNVWADVLKPASGTESLAQYANQFYAGQTAVTYRRLGKGSVTYVGVQTKDGQLEKEVLREVYRRAGIGTEDYPQGVYVDWRDGFWVAVNYSSLPADILVPKGAEILYGTQPLKPADVLVWR